MNPSDTIGLTEFLVLVYNFIKRNFIILSIFTLIGFVVGMSYTYKKPNYYTSELVGFSNVIEKTTLLEILTPLTTLTAEKNYDALSTKLGITKEDAAQIRNLEFTNSKHTKTSHAPTATDKKLGELILTRVEIYDQNSLANIENGISNYISQNNYVKSLENLEKQKNKNLITEISNNLALIDSINHSINQPKNTLSILPGVNPFNYKEALLELEELKMAAQTTASFTIVSRFYTVKNPSNKNMLIIIAATVAFFVMGLIIVFIKELAMLSKA